jgi:hypothetical protein
MKLLHYGIDHLKYYLDLKNIIQLLIYGQLPVFFIKLHIKEYSFVVILKLIRYLRYFKLWGHRIKMYGKMLLNLKILKELFLNGKVVNLTNLIQKYQIKE